MGPDRGVVSHPMTDPVPSTQRNARQDIEREAKAHLQRADEAEQRVQSIEVELKRWSTEMRQHRSAAHALAATLNEEGEGDSHEEPNAADDGSWPGRATSRTLDRLSRED